MALRAVVKTAAGSAPLHGGGAPREDRPLVAPASFSSQTAGGEFLNYWCGLLFHTSPVSGTSRFDLTVLPGDVIQWPARPWALYFVESSDDGVNWQPVRSIIPPHFPGQPTATVTASVAVPRDPFQNRQLVRTRQIW